MTWVIGASSPFGFGVVFSDIKVSFGGGHPPIDILQKTYPIAPFMVGGFAGSVKLGFKLLADLRRFTSEPKGVAWRANEVAWSWHNRARQIFEAEDKLQRKLGSSLLLVGVSPDENLCDSSWARTHLIRMAAPHFRPGIMKRGLNVCHIGSGSKIPVYKQKIKADFASPDFAIRLIEGGPSIWSAAVGYSIGNIIEEYPNSGISSHFQMFICQRDSVSAINNDRTEFPSNGGEPVEFKMPVIAKSYREFREMCSARHLSTSRATA